MPDYILTAYIAGIVQGEARCSAERLPAAIEATFPKGADAVMVEPLANALATMANRADELAREVERLILSAQNLALSGVIPELAAAADSLFTAANRMKE